MCTPQFVSQQSWDLGMYLPSEMNIEESSAYQSAEALISSFHMGTSSSVHRNKCGVFDQMNDDLEAMSALTNDEEPSMIDDSSELLADSDFFDYWLETSTVVPHFFSSTTETTTNANLPLSPSPTDTYKKQKKAHSTPSSPIQCTYSSINTKKFFVYDDLTGRERRPLLHEFIRLLLENDEYSDIAEYIDRKQGVFKLFKPKEVAELWKYVKGRNSDAKMTYDKLARAIRYYYSSGIMHSSPGRFTFRFGARSGFGTTWWPAY